MTSQSSPAARVFVSYAHEDEELRRALGSHLAPLERQGVIAAWHDRKILPGSDWAGEIDRELEEADLVLLLVSSDFVASDYCYEIEMERAMARHRAGKARVVPVILRPCDWQVCPFARLAALPEDGRAVTEAANRDVALRQVARGVGTAIAEFRDHRSDALYGYLRGLLEETAHLNIRGIAPTAGNVQGALRQPIEALYTPLRSRGELGCGLPEDGEGEGSAGGRSRRAARAPGAEPAAPDRGSAGGR